MFRHGARLVVIVLAAAASTCAQKVISAKSGLVYFVQGRVFVEGSGRLRTGARLRQLTQGETLITENGRAEVLLNPGTVLRLGEMSRVRMDNVSLADARLCLVSGSAVITVTEIRPKPDLVEVSIAGGVILLKHPGIYRLDTQAARLRVYDGRAEVHRENAEPGVIVRGKQATGLEDLLVAKFDPKDTDPLERWAELRSRRPAPRGLRPMPPSLGFTPPSQAQPSEDRTLTPPRLP